MQEESSDSDADSGPENLSLRKPDSPPPVVHRSPVDVLLRVFPSRQRSDIEAALHRAKGDVLQAIEIMVGPFLLISNKIMLKPEHC